jgi:hypothetical protein
MNVRAAVVLAALLFASVAEAAGVPPPGCVGTTWTRTWSRIDTDLDPFTLQTTAVYFKIQAPCYVTFDTEFVITTKVVDERCAPGDVVGNHWNITDTDMTSGITSTIAGAGVGGLTGFSGIFLNPTAPDPSWVFTVSQRYRPPSAAVNHRIGFRFLARKDSDCFVSGMNWSAEIIGTTTYDPYPDTSTADPTPPASTDPAPPASTDPGVPGSTDGGGTGDVVVGVGGAPVMTPPATPSAESGGCGSSGVTPALLGIAALVAAGFPRRRRAR